jgi:hypothetical protein
LDRLRDAPAKDQGKAFEPANETGWVRGTAGILLSFLHRYPFESDSLFKQAKPAIGGDDFLGGDAGMGIYHMNRYRLTGAPESLECVNRLADFFIPRIDKEFFTVNGGLFCSDLVIAYFLMNVINIENGTDNVFAPFLTGTSGARATCFDKKPRLKIGAVRKRLLYRYFGRTIDLMDTFAPKVLNSYLDDYREEETGDELDRFIGFVGSAIEKITAAPAYDPLKDLFGFELNKYKAICSDQRTNIHIYLDNLSRCDATIGLLNNSDSWLFGQKLAVSRQIKSVQSKWDWTIRENTNILQNFYSPPGAFECVFRPSHEQRVIEHPLKIDGLILYRFSQPKKIGQALMELNTFCRQLDETALKEFWVSTGSKDAKDFINRLDFLALHKIKQLLWEGLLEFQV